MDEELYGWVTLADADAYMAARLGASSHWTSGVDKGAALVTAYNCLALDTRWDFSLDSGEYYPDEWIAAQCEQALFLLADPDMDARLSIQAQGVTNAGVVQETYQPASRFPIAPRAVQALAPYRNPDYNVLDWQ